MLRDRRAAELAKQGASELLFKVRGGMTLEDAAASLMAPAGGAGQGDAASEPSDPLAPQVRETRPFGRTGTAIPGPFDSTPLVKAAYELTEEKPLPDAPMQLGDDWFVYQLDTRTVADRAAFTEDEQRRIAEGLLQRKRSEVLEAYVRGLRDAATAGKEIRVDATAADQSALPTS
jgi:peptidyl-prolyl cis-trans isomerase D